VQKLQKAFCRAFLNYDKKMYSRGLYLSNSLDYSILGALFSKIDFTEVSLLFY